MALSGKLAMLQKLAGGVAACVGLPGTKQCQPLAAAAAAARSQIYMLVAAPLVCMMGPSYL